MSFNLLKIVLICRNYHSKIEYTTLINLREKGFDEEERANKRASQAFPNLSMN